MNSGIICQLFAVISFVEGTPESKKKFIYHFCPPPLAILAVLLAVLRSFFVKMIHEIESGQWYKSMTKGYRVNQVMNSFSLLLLFTENKVFLQLMQRLTK